MDMILKFGREWSFLHPVCPVGYPSRIADEYSNAARSNDFTDLPAAARTRSVVGVATGTGKPDDTRRRHRSFWLADETVRGIVTSTRPRSVAMAEEARSSRTAEADEADASPEAP
jgi:hypothetical protein